jgi:hypothetical protein
VDSGFHGDRSYRTDGTDADVQGLHPWLGSGHPFGVGVIGLWHTVLYTGSGPMFVVVALLGV